MPFISNGVYNLNSSDPVWSRTLQKEFVSVDKTFFDKVLMNYNNITGTIANNFWIANPFFVKNDILYCAGYFGDPSNSSDKLLHWYTYDIQKKTYTVHNITTPFNYYWSSSFDYVYSIIPLYHIDNLKFYCVIARGAYMGGNIDIIDYDKNTCTDTGGTWYGMIQGFYTTRTGIVYSAINSSYGSIHRMDLRSNPPVNTDIGGYIDYVIGVRSLETYDEIITVHNTRDTYSREVVRLQIDRYPSVGNTSKFIENDDNTICGGSGYWSAVPACSMYTNIFLFWMAFGNSPSSLFITGKTDYDNSHQPFKELLSMGNETLTDVVSGSSVNFTSYDTSNSRKYVNCARPAIIPDIDKPFLYAIPNNRYGSTRYNSMLRINIETLKTVDDNGGII